MRALHDYVFVLPDADTKETKGGIYLPDSSKEKSQRGTVLIAGPGKYTADGVLVPTLVKTGDKVLFARNIGMDIEIPNDIGVFKVTIMHEDVIVAVLE